MNLWHLTPDAPRDPRRVSPGQPVTLVIGSWPIEAGQAVWVEGRLEHVSGESAPFRAAARWQRNRGANSYWQADIGPFERGVRVRYTPRGRAPSGEAVGPSATFAVGPKLYLALLWHQHQPLYKDLAHPTPRGSYRQPWVRLHALRDYHAMAALAAEHPNLHLAINLTPVLLWQLMDYAWRGASDRALELTLKPAETLTPGEREELLGGFFDANWHQQIYPHPRYKELLERRVAREPFDLQELRDLQMWFNLTWFGEEFREGAVALVTGETASVRCLVAKQRNFTQDDIVAMVTEQLKILRAVVPLHRALQERGQLEVTTTPFHHPILPLLVDTDQATIDRPGASYPRRFAHPEDAAAQLAEALRCYQGHFACAARGVWPAEGAVSRSIIPLLAAQGVRWIATDQGVLARSGRWGYRTDDPEVLCQPYRAEEGGQAVAVFFRDTELADAIGFRYQTYDNDGAAARDFVQRIKTRFADRLQGDEDRVLTVVLDGENAWGAYREDARPFLHALYGLLEADAEIETVTFGEYLEGNPLRGIAPHPLERLAQVHELFTGSWIDESGSAPGVDLGTWIGEAEENRAWELLGEARAALAGTAPEAAPAAFAALYAAEGSDWFWWFGDDQDSGNDEEFDELFRLHLQNAYRGLGLAPPDALEQPIVPRTVLWRFTQPVQRIGARDRLTVRTNCPGVLRWQLDGGPLRKAPLAPAGGVMAGVRRYHLMLGPFPAGTAALRFRFFCTHPSCPGTDLCCRGDEHAVAVG